MSKPDLTGQLLFWDKGPKDGVHDGRHAIQVFGIISARAEIARLLFSKEMMKHTVYGGYSPEAACFNLVAPDDMRVLLCSDQNDKNSPYSLDSLRGHTPDSLLTKPLWKI